jgi:spoIIIJ-associated protein
MDDDDKDLERILGDNLTEVTSTPDSNDDPDAAKSGTELDGPQGDDEEQTESYSTYDKGAPEPVTKRSASSASGVNSSADEQTGAVRAALNEDIEEAIQYAKRYLEDLLSFFGLNTDVYATTEDKEVIELDIPSTHLNGFLIGQHGDTVRALQYTISNALRSQNFAHTRVNVDVAEYKKQRANRLASAAEQWFKEVRDSGKPKDLQPMNAADRRVVHQAATDFGLETESVGFGRDRHIVLKPAANVEATPPPDKE